MEQQEWKALLHAVQHPGADANIWSRFCIAFPRSTRDMLAMLKKRKNQLVIGGVVMAEVILVMWGGPLVRTVPISVSKHLLCIMLSCSSLCGSSAIPEKCGSSGLRSEVIENRPKS